MNECQKLATGMLALVPLLFWFGGGWAVQNMNDCQMIALVMLISAPLMFLWGSYFSLGEESSEAAIATAQRELQNADTVLANAMRARDHSYRKYQELNEGLSSKGNSKLL